MCNTSRQAHLQTLQRAESQAAKACLYLRQMQQVRSLHPGMGLRTIYHLLQPQEIGRDAFEALGVAHGLRLSPLQQPARTTYSTKSHRYGNLLAGRWFNGYNQVWSSDITYYRLADRFYYITLVMDAYSRRLLGYALADNLRAENNLAALRMALKTRNKATYNNSLIHHSDKGTQYASDDYTQLLQANGIGISMCSEVWENTHIERLNQTIKNQYLERMDIPHLPALQKALKKTADLYNCHRPHQSLGRMTPVQYEKHLDTLPQTQRTKMSFYTPNQLPSTIPDKNQLCLFII